MYCALEFAMFVGRRGAYTICVGKVFFALLRGQCGRGTNQDVSGVLATTVVQRARCKYSPFVPCLLCHYRVVWAQGKPLDSQFWNSMHGIAHAAIPRPSTASELQVVGSDGSDLLCAKGTLRIEPVNCFRSPAVTCPCFVQTPGGKICATCDAPFAFEVKASSCSPLLCDRPRCLPIAPAPPPSRARATPSSEQHQVLFPHLLEPGNLVLPFSGGP